MQKEQLIAKFQELYGEGGEIRTYFAPGRVNLIGELTDYNGGHVFPCALTMGTWAVVRNREDRKLGFFSLNFEKLGIIETSLKNYFQGVYGRGYSELLNEIRMKKAAELILKNSMKISEISDAVGFATQSRFAKAFKNYYGAAPLEYKRKHNLNKDSRQMELSDNK